MNKYVLGLVLAALGGGATAADWKKVTVEKDADIYADAASISRRGNVVKMSNLRNYRTPTVTGSTKYSSEKYVAEYDCEGKRVGRAEQRFYTGPMGTGALFNYFSVSPPGLKAIVPGTLDETLWKLACGRK